MADLEDDCSKISQKESISITTRWKSEVNMGFVGHGVYLV